jgi:hypothetical protein
MKANFMRQTYSGNYKYGNNYPRVALIRPSVSCRPSVGTRTYQHFPMINVRCHNYLMTFRDVFARVHPLRWRLRLLKLDRCDRLPRNELLPQIYSVYTVIATWLSIATAISFACNILHYLLITIHPNLQL